MHGEFYGERILAVPSPWGHKESDMTEGLGLPVAIHQQREFSCKRGTVWHPHWRTCFRECWLSYLEKKTEVEEGLSVVWLWMLALLPLLGSHIQTAIGSALTVFYAGFGTRPRGKQREFLLRRKATRCFQLTRIGMESLKGRTGPETGAYLNSAFGNASSRASRSLVAIPG